MKMMMIFLWILLSSCTHHPSHPTESFRVQNWSKELQNKEPPVPYVKLYSQYTKKLFYLASAYSTDPEGPTQQLIKKEISAQLPNLIIIEGVESELGMNPSKVSQAIRNSSKMDQSVFAASLGQKMKIPFMGGDISPIQVKEAFKHHEVFNVKDLISFLLLKEMVNLHLNYPALGLKESLRRSYGEFNRKFDLASEEVVSDQEFLAWFKQWMGRDFEEKRLSYLDVAPVCKEGAIKPQLIHCEIEKIRNAHLVSIIQEELSHYDKVMVIYGAGYLVSEDEALKTFLPETKYLQ